MPSPVTFRLYNNISSLGGSWGICAQDVAGMLDGLDADVTDVVLRINSPGGEVPESLAILNLLRSHPARVTAVVDGIAASAASFIAAGVDELVMSPNSELMIHDARGIAVGDADLMQKFTDLLAHMSDNIASIYAAKAGGTKDGWRELMGAETWFSADEAVEAKLADRVETVSSPKPGNPGSPKAADPEPIAARFDLSIFNYAGRENAPAPNPPSASAVGSVNTSERGSAVAFTAEQLTNMRQDLGLAGDADEATIVAALSEALTERADPPASPPTPPVAPVAEAVIPAPSNAAPVPAPSAPGTMTIDTTAWDAQQERIQRLEAADKRRRVEERDQVIAQAVTEGKFPNARSEHWARLWDADPEGTRQVIDGLTRFVVPVNELGHGGGDDGSSVDDEFAHIFPPALSQNGA